MQTGDKQPPNKGSAGKRSTLRCTPAQVVARLHRRRDLGFDDAVLVVSRPNDASLAALRALLPRP